jgi:RNA 3'-terminal phosphate cyclase (ATP)
MPFDPSFPRHSDHLLQLDGSEGEGGGQILRTALTLSLLTGQSFLLQNIRDRRERPGLRPQHLAAVRAAQKLCNARVEGACEGSKTLRFVPGSIVARDLELDLGTAGATALVLQTIHLPLALHASQSIHIRLKGGTFNDKAPSFPFLDSTWRLHQAALGLSIALSMPQAGFYPSGGGYLEARIEPGRPRSLMLGERGRLSRIQIVAGFARLTRNRIAERMCHQAEKLLRTADVRVPINIRIEEWQGRSPGAAIVLIAEHDANVAPFTIVGLGAQGKPAELVAQNAVDVLLADLSLPGAVDSHSADQLLLPLALADGPSSFTTTSATEHLRTNVSTISAFLNREIHINDGTTTYVSIS